MKVKQLIRKIIPLVLSFIGYGLAGVAFHEIGHLITNNALGGTGNIFYNYTLTAGHMEWATLPQNNIWLVYLGGGLFAAIIMFLFFWLPPKLTESDQDVYIEAMVASQILANLFQAGAELVLYYRGINLYDWVRIAAYLTAAIIFDILYIKILIKWVNRLNNNNYCGK